MGTARGVDLRALLHLMRAVLQHVLNHPCCSFAEVSAAMPQVGTGDLYLLLRLLESVGIVTAEVTAPLRPASATQTPAVGGGGGVGVLGGGLDLDAIAAAYTPATHAPPSSSPSSAVAASGVTAGEAAWVWCHPDMVEPKCGLLLTRHIYGWRDRASDASTSSSSSGTSSSSSSGGSSSGASGGDAAGAVAALLVGTLESLVPDAVPLPQLCTSFIATPQAPRLLAHLFVGAGVQ